MWYSTKIINQIFRYIYRWTWDAHGLSIITANWRKKATLFKLRYFLHQYTQTSCIIHFYYIDTRVLLENTPLARKIHTKPHLGLEWRIFHIITVKISMISLISSLSLKLYLNSLVYDRNIFGSSPKVFGNLRISSENFGKCSATFVWPSGKFWRIFGNLRKIVKNAVISMSIQ